MLGVIAKGNILSSSPWGNGSSISEELCWNRENGYKSRWRIAFALWKI